MKNLTSVTATVPVETTDTRRNKELNARLTVDGITGVVMVELEDIPSANKLLERIGAGADIFVSFQEPSDTTGAH